MKANIDKSLIEDFGPDSQLWIYQASPSNQLSKQDILEIQEDVKKFAANWQVHGQPVKAFGDFIFGKFILFAVSNQSPASGCSIDTSVEFIRQLGSKYNTDFFNRTAIALVNPTNGAIEELPLAKIKEGLNSGELSQKIYFFNNTINKLGQLDGEWIVAFEDSWLNPELV